MSEGKIDKLARMANQIGDFFASQPQDQAAKGVANHLRRFWTPKMIHELIAALEGGREDLNATAALGVEELKRDGPS